MKKIILCTVLLLAGMTLGAEARGSRTASKQNTSVTVVSDTTTNGNMDEADNTDDEDNTTSLQAQIDSAVQQAINQNDQDLDNQSDVWIVFIVFALPVLLVAVILYFIYRNRKEKYELQKIAMEKGFNPNTVYYTGKPENDPGSKATDGTQGLNKAYSSVISNLPDSMTPNEVLWEKGVKQMCLGIGLALLLGFIIDAEFSVIGLLVFFMGLGKAVISKTRKNPVDNSGYQDINQRYDTTNGRESSTADDKPGKNDEN